MKKKNCNAVKTAKIVKNEESSEALWNNIERDKNAPPLTYNGQKVPSVIRLVGDKVYYTENLSIFKKCSYNRDVIFLGALKIILSALLYGWIVPIIKVNSRMEVIAGQHSLVAAKLLNAPVYYVISEDLAPEQLVAGEVMTKWKDIEALKTYAKTNIIAAKIKEYYFAIIISLKKRKETLAHLSLPQFLAILYRTPKFVYGLKTNGGVALLNKLADCDTTNPTTNKIFEVMAFAQKNCITPGIKRSTFLIGLTTFIFENEKTLNFNRLLAKLKLFKPVSGTSDDYYNQIKEIYN